MKDKEKQITKSCKNCICNRVCDKKLDLKYFFDNHDCEHYQPKLPEDNVANRKLFDEFIDFAKKEFGIKIIKDDINGKEYTFEEVLGINPNKEKQIEEIKLIIDERCEAELGQVHASSMGGKVTKTVSTKLIAKDIYEYLTKDSVVLSMEEWKEYEQFKSFLERNDWENIEHMETTLDKCQKVLYERLQQTSKKTAEKILKDITLLIPNEIEIITRYFKQILGIEIKE